MICLTKMSHEQLKCHGIRCQGSGCFCYNEGTKIGGSQYGNIRSEKLKKIYTTRFGGNQVQALSNVSFSVEQGEYVAIMGESGSGKTTLLNILLHWINPTFGEVLLQGKSLATVKEKEISAFRRDNLGFVFQDFNLLDTFYAAG